MFSVLQTISQAMLISLYISCLQDSIEICLLESVIVCFFAIHQQYIHSSILSSRIALFLTFHKERRQAIYFVYKPSCFPIFLNSCFQESQIICELECAQSVYP